jgi:hypothetical protein
MRASRFITIITSIAVIAGGLSAVAPAASAQAAEEKFDPGHLISDALMFDGGAMSVAQIQSFLNGKVKTCSSTAQRECLKTIKATQVAHPPVANRCAGDIPAKAAQTAAQIIYAAAVACNVSPKVLLVTLQKEQGLVTKTSPTATNYKIATGYGCPDGQDCDADFFGFSNQVYWAARAFQAYKNSPDTFPLYQPGTRPIKYHPDAARCGTKSVSVDNVATTGLYTYTPYTPNAAALANLSGTGDSCSSYGNRNFWNYYNSWFGNTGAGDYLVKYGSTTSLIADGGRWSVPSTATRLLSTIGSFDATATVSSAYINAVTSKGALGIVATASSGNAYVLASGKKYLLDSCTVATSIGFPCATAPEIPSSALAKLTTSTVLAGKTRIKTQTAAKQNYVLEGGVRREFLSSTAVDGAPLGSTVQVDASLLSSIAYGVPYLATDSLTAVRGSNDYVLTTGTESYRFPSRFISQTAADEWFDTPSGALDEGSVAKLPSVSAFPSIFFDGTRSYVMAAAGKLVLTASEEWSTTIPTIDADVASRIPTIGHISGPVFVRTVSSSKVYLVAGGERRAVASADVAKIAATLGISSTVRKITSDSVAAITLAGSIIPAGTVVRTAATGPYYLIDGESTRIPLSAATAKEFLGTATARTVSEAALSEYTVSAQPLLPGVSCATSSYLAISGVLRKVTPEVAAEYGSAYGFTSIDQSTCLALTRSSTMGVFLKYGTRYFEVEDGTTKELTAAQYKTASQGEIPARTVSKYFLQLLPRQ